MMPEAMSKETTNHDKQFLQEFLKHSLVMLCQIKSIFKGKTKKKATLFWSLKVITSQSIETISLVTNFFRMIFKVQRKIIPKKDCQFLIHTTKNIRQLCSVRLKYFQGRTKKGLELTQQAKTLKQSYLGNQRYV